MHSTWDTLVVPTGAVQWTVRFSLAGLATFTGRHVGWTTTSGCESISTMTGSSTRPWGCSHGSDDKPIPCPATEAIEATALFGMSLKVPISTPGMRDFAEERFHHAVADWVKAGWPNLKWLTKDDEYPDALGYIGAYVEAVRDPDYDSAQGDRLMTLMFEECEAYVLKVQKSMEAFDRSYLNSLGLDPDNPPGNA